MRDRQLRAKPRRAFRRGHRSSRLLRPRRRRPVLRGGPWPLAVLVALLAALILTAALTGYWWPALAAAILLILAWVGYAVRVTRPSLAGPRGPGGPGAPGGAGVREPRRPKPNAPAG